MTRLNGRRGLMPRAVARRLAHSDDSGATLIFALIFITAVAVMIAAVLSFVDTSMRTTIAVRDEGAQAAAADGAAQLAINTIREHGFAHGGSGSCLDGLPALGGLYQQGGTTYSASVTCDLDPDDSVKGGAGGLPITDKNRPGQAVLTLDPPSGDGGLDVTLGGDDTLLVHGDIYSNSYITVKKNLTSNAMVTAAGTCTGTLNAAPPGPKCNTGVKIGDPKYDPPAGPTKLATLPKCPASGNLLQFEPGLYTDSKALNDLMQGNDGSKKGCPDAIYWFPPGVYYFDLDRGGEWSIPDGYVVGGIPTDSHLGQPGHATAEMPLSCRTPIPPDDDKGTWTSPGPDAGVEFVLGGATHITLGSNSNMELCGSYGTDAPPIAIYGLKDTIGSGSLTVHAESTSDCVRKSSGGAGCAVLDTSKHPGSLLFIQGTTYAPLAWVNVDLNNKAGQMFRYGIITRKLTLTATASADLSVPIIEVPDFVFAGPTRTVLYLQVFVCAGTTPCPTGGGAQPQLKVKVGIIDPDGIAKPGARQVTVYNWSVQRN
jgi:hypothetical protein